MLVYWIKENPNIIVINRNNITIQSVGSFSNVKSILSTSQHKKQTTARLIHAMTAKLVDFTTSESLVGHSVLPDSRCVEVGKGCVEVSNVAVVEVRVRGRVEDSNAAAQSASFAYMPTQEA